MREFRAGLDAPVRFAVAIGAAFAFAVAVAVVGTAIEYLDYLDEKRRARA